MTPHSNKWRISVWAMLLTAGTLLALAARGAGPLPGDLAVTRWLQQALPFDSPLAGLLVRAEDLVWLSPLIVLAVVLLLRQWIGALMILAGSVSAGLLIGPLLKSAVMRPRPAASLVQVYDFDSSLSFPSGTALFGMVLLGMTCYVVWHAIQARPWLRAHTHLIGIMTLLISLLVLIISGCSRIYVGGHWATDVVGGWLWGGVWLVIVINTYRRLLAKRIGGPGRGNDLPARIGRLGGAAMIAGGTLWVVKGGAILLGGPDLGSLLIVGQFLCTIGLLGLYLRLNGRGGRLRAIASLLIWIALPLSGLNALHSVLTQETVFPWTVSYAIAALSLFVGLIVLGWATRWAQTVPPRVASLPLVIGLLAPLMFLLMGGMALFVDLDEPPWERLLEVPIVVLGIGWIALGYVLLLACPDRILTRTKGEAHVAD